MAVQDYPRTKYEAQLDIDYGLRVHEIHARLLARVRWCIAFVQVAAALGAAAPFFTQGDARYVPLLGLLLGIVTVVDAISDFAGQRFAHREKSDAYADLKGRSGPMTVEQIDAKLAVLEKFDGHVIEALRRPAFNQVVIRHGRTDYVLPLGPFERFVGVIA